MHGAPSFTLELCPSSEGLVVLFGPTDAGAWGRWVRNLDSQGLRTLSQGVLSSVASSTRRGRPRGDGPQRLAAAGAALADGALPAEVKRALAKMGPGTHLRLILHGTASQAPGEAMVILYYRCASCRAPLFLFMTGAALLSRCCWPRRGLGNAAATARCARAFN